MSLSKLEQEIDQCTDEKNTKDDWNQIYECVDQINSSRRQKDALKILVRKLRHRNPHVSMQGLTLLDSCVANCGHEFHRELCTKSFCSEAKSILGSKTINGQVLQRFAFLLRKWSQMDEIKKDTSLGLLGDLVSDLRAMGHTFDYENKASGSLDAAAASQPRPSAGGGIGGSGRSGVSGSGGGGGGGGSRSSAASSTQDMQALRKEEEDLAKAIAMSLQEQQQQPLSTSPQLRQHQSQSRLGGSSLYPAMSLPSNDYLMGASAAASGASGLVGSAPPPPIVKRVRALYDFEAAEDNELTFHTGDLILVDDCSDPNWWHGSTPAGAAGLFPATFVEEDTAAAAGSAGAAGSGVGGKGVSFNDQVAVKLIEEPLTIDPSKIDECLAMLENCDPTGDPNRPDPPELPRLEERCRLMAPLIDAEIEKLDRKYLELHQLNSRLAESFQLYHHLMSASAPPPPPPAQLPQPPPQSVYYPPPSVVPGAASSTSGYAPAVPAYGSAVYPTAAVAAGGLPQQPPPPQQLDMHHHQQQQQQQAAYMQQQMMMMQQQQQQQQPPPLPQQQQQQQPLYPGGGYNGQPPQNNQSHLQFMQQQQQLPQQLL